MGEEGRGGYVTLFMEGELMNDRMMKGGSLDVYGDVIEQTQAVLNLSSRTQVNLFTFSSFFWGSFWSHLIDDHR